MVGRVCGGTTCAASCKDGREPASGTNCEAMCGTPCGVAGRFGAAGTCGTCGTAGTETIGAAGNVGAGDTAGTRGAAGTAGMVDARGVKVGCVCCAVWSAACEPTAGAGTGKVVGADTPCGGTAGTTGIDGVGSDGVGSAGVGSGTVLPFPAGSAV